jgi:hypothetical protein
MSLIIVSTGMVIFVLAFILFIKYQERKEKASR